MQQTSTKVESSIKGLCPMLQMQQTTIGNSIEASQKTPIKFKSIR
jgi:hypothetical protein